MINNFNFYAPTDVQFGKGTVDLTAQMLKKYGANKVLIHYGGNSAKKSGLLDKVENLLKDNDIAYVTLGGVVPNPRMSLVYEGIELVRKEKVDFILAVGGGSVIDSSKAIAYGVPYDGDAWDFWGVKRVTATKALPIGVILTIAAAGSEMSNSCVITKDDEGRKRGYSSNLVRPKFAIMDPELTSTLPDYQTMCGCTDIIMHTMERYFTSKGNMVLTDYFAEGLIKTVMHYAKVLHKDPKNYEARAEVMWASSLSHNGITGCGNGGDDFVTHGLEHELSGMFDVTHGAGLAAVWGSWARYVQKNIPERFIKFAENIMDIKDSSSDEDKIEAGISGMEAFFKEIGMPVSIKGLGIDPTDDDLHKMAELYGEGCGGKKGSAQLIYAEDAYKIYKMAL